MDPVTTRRLVLQGIAAVLMVAATRLLLAPPAHAMLFARRTPHNAWPIQRDVRVYESDAAAHAAVHSQLGEVLDAIASANRRRLAGRAITVHVIPQTANLTDLPAFASRGGRLLPDKNPHDDYVEARTWDELRGFARECGTTAALEVFVGEEQVVTLPDVARGAAGYTTDDPGYVLVHEIAHVIECGLTPAQQTALSRMHLEASERLDIVGRHPSYTASTRSEYFAEGTVAWFNAGGHHSYQRAWLANHDPELYDLLSEIYDARAG
jgi:hypothetical protein